MRFFLHLTGGVGDDLYGRSRAARKVALGSSSTTILPGNSEQRFFFRHKRFLRGPRRSGAAIRHRDAKNRRETAPRLVADPNGEKTVCEQRRAGFSGRRLRRRDRLVGGRETVVGGAHRRKDHGKIDETQRRQHGAQPGRQQEDDRGNGERDPKTTYSQGNALMVLPEKCGMQLAIGKANPSR